MKRKISSTQVEDQRRGSTRIAPGIWVDRHGGVHVSVEELLVHFAIEDTPANRAQVAETVRAEIARREPDVDIIEQEEQTH